MWAWYTETMLLESDWNWKGDTPSQVFQSSASMYPSGQAQKAVPSVLRHEWEQPPLSVRHSSISSQECPSTANWVPVISSQLQRYDPWVLWQTSWQGPWPLRNEHSFTSDNNDTKSGKNTVEKMEWWEGTRARFPIHQHRSTLSTYRCISCRWKPAGILVDKSRGNCPAYWCTNRRTHHSPRHTRPHLQRQRTIKTRE